MAHELPLTEFDSFTVNQALQMFKAMIPFLDYPLQRTLSLFIRINELWQTMRFYSSPKNLSVFSACSLSSAEHSSQTVHSVNDILQNDQLLDTVLKYCPEQYASMIRGYRQFSKMSELMNAMNIMDSSEFTMPFGAGGSPGNSSKPGGPVNPADLLAGLFSDKAAQAKPEPQAKPQTQTNPQTQAKPQAQTNQQTQAKQQTGNSAPSSGGNSQEKQDGSGMAASALLNRFMNPKQQELYNSYITQLDQIDLEKHT